MSTEYQEPVNTERKFIHIDSAVWNYFAQSPEKQQQLINYLTKQDFTVLINKQLIFEIAQYPNESAVKDRISLIKSVPKLFTLTGPPFILGYLEIAFLFLRLQGKNGNTLFPKFISPLPPTHFDKYIQGAIAEIPEMKRQKSSYSHTLLMGKANAKTGDNAHKLTLPMLEELLHKNQFHAALSFSTWANKYKKYMGKGISPEDQESHLNKAVETLENADINSEIKKMRQEVNDYRISDDLIFKLSLMELDDRIYLIRQFKHVIPYLPKEEQSLEKMYAILSNRDFKLFPGHFLFYKVTHFLNKSEASTKASETFDLLSLFMAPMVDVFTSDDQINETIRQVVRKHRVPIKTKFIANKYWQKTILNQ